MMYFLKKNYSFAYTLAGQNWCDKTQTKMVGNDVYVPHSLCSIKTTTIFSFHCSYSTFTSVYMQLCAYSCNYLCGYILLLSVALLQNRTHVAPVV